MRLIPLGDVIAIINKARSYYDERVFPPSSQSPDARAAAGARVACDAIVADLEKYLKDADDD